MSHGFPLTPEEGPTADTANLAINGKINSLSSITLTINSATTVVLDFNATPDSIYLFDPTTANAATELYGGAMYVSTRGDRTFTITHVNSATADRTFRSVILG